MPYTYDEFAKLTEEQAIADVLKTLGGPLFDIMVKARADVTTRFPADLFPKIRVKSLANSEINAHATKLWQEENQLEWTLSDASGFLHLTHEATGLKIVLRRVDPKTRSLPKSNRTKVGTAYYLQSSCKKAGELKPREATLFNGNSGLLIPDLSGTRLIVAWDGAWDDIDNPLILCAYRPIDIAEYGRPNAYDFKMELTANKDEYAGLRFEPMPEAEPLPNLLVQEDEMEEERVNVESGQTEGNKPDIE